MNLHKFSYIKRQIQFQKSLSFDRWQSHCWRKFRQWKLCSVILPDWEIPLLFVFILWLDAFKHFLYVYFFDYNILYNLNLSILIYKNNIKVNLLKFDQSKYTDSNVLTSDEFTDRMLINVCTYILWNIYVHFINSSIKIVKRIFPKQIIINNVYLRMIILEICVFSKT